MSRRFGVGISCMTGAMLLAQLLLTRIFSVTLWYHLAFFVISLAFLGTSAGGVAVALFPRVSGDRSSERVAWYAIGVSLAIVIGCWCYLQIRFAPTGLGWGNLARLVATSILVGLPFFFGGVAVALALARYAETAGRLYFFDLFGAGLACLLAVPLLDAVSAPTAILAAACLAAIGALLLGWSAARVRRAAAACAAALAALTLTNEWTNLMSIRFVKGTEEARPLYSGWNSFSRISVIPGGQFVHSWGLSETYDGPLVPQLFLFIDAEANTPITKFSGDLDEVRYVRDDVTALAYHLFEKPRTLIIGPGGGRDILTALSFGSPYIEAVEINPLIVDVVNRRFGDFSGYLYDHPAVHLAIDEGRTFIRRSAETYDVIQLSLVDTWAATSAGAYALSESYLYTVEAFQDYLRRLRPGGVLSVSRYLGPETHRLVAIVREALEREGVERPEDSLFVANRNLVNTLLVKNGAFTPAEIAGLVDVTTRLRFPTVYVPGHDELSQPAIAQQLRGDDRTSSHRLGAYDVSPTFDDRPFFFFFFSPGDLSSGAREATGQFFNNQANFILACVIAIASLATLTAVLLPLFVMRRQALTSTSGWPTIVTFFGCLGAGYIIVEIQLLQRFILFLGQPVYSLTVVLFSLLVSSGLGSFTIGRRMATATGRRHLMGIVAMLAVGLAASAYVYPVLLASSIGLPTPARVVMSAALIIPLGFLMGMPFPGALQLLGTRRAQIVPWVFGINGAMSVLGSSAALLIAIAFGFRVVTLIAAFVYLAAMLLLAKRNAWAAREADRSDPNDPIVPRQSL